MAGDRRHDLQPFAVGTARPASQADIQSTRDVILDRGVSRRAADHPDDPAVDELGQSDL